MSIIIWMLWIVIGLTIIINAYLFLTGAWKDGYIPSDYEKGKLSDNQEESRLRAKIGRVTGGKF